MIALPAGKFTEMVGKYVMEKTDATFTPGMYQAFMVVNDNQDFVAGVVISNFRKWDCDISCVSETPAAWRPHVCRAIFKYVFDQLGCVRCTSITSKANRKARSFLESLGFQLEGNARLGYDGRRDAMIYGLLRSECRFLTDDNGMTDGEEQSNTASSAGPGSDCGGPDTRQHYERDGASEPEPHQSGDAAGQSYVFPDGNQF